MNINQSLEDSYAESRRIIRQAMQNNQLVLFVGAGVSVDSGMPKWSTAIKQIKDRLGLTGNDSDAFQIPQYYYDERGKNEYTSLMRHIFKYGEHLEANDIHKQIIKFNTQTIITTNYDHLIEQAAEENAEIMQVISCDTDLAYENSGKELIKMHGDFEHDNFVLKEDDYLNYSSNFKLIENRIKSIFGSKIVLFIGYSFNDPDIKQIFSWVKSILKKDLHRAYLINVDSDYDKERELYYRNLGVNIIFAKAWLSDKQEDDPGKILCNTLNKILKPDKLTPIDSLYKDLRGFKDFNYVYKKYMASAFLTHNIGLSDNCLSELTQFSKHNSSLPLLSKIFDDKFLDENKKVDKNKIYTLRNIIQNSCVTDYKINNKKYSLSKHEPSEWAKYILEFDFNNLEELKIKTDSFLNESDSKAYLMQASLSYYLNDPTASYNYLRRASNHLYQKKMYAYYFISEVDRKYLGKYILNANQYGNISIDPQIINQIRNEVNNINLEHTLNSLPNLGNNNFLKEIMNFTIFYSLFQEVYEKSIKTKNEANDNFAFYFGVPTYDQLRKNIEDFLKYELENYILLDNYQENVEIYRMFIRSIIASTTAPDKNYGAFALKLPTHNVHSKNLTKLELYIILKFCGNSKDISDMFNSYSISYIDTDSEAQNYLEIIVHNIIKARNRVDELYWNLIALCGHISLNNKVVDQILKSLSLKMTYNDFTEHQNIIIEFLINAEGQKLINENEVSNLNKILDLALDDILTQEQADYENLIISLCNCLKELHNPYNDIKRIDKLLNLDLGELKNPIVDMFHYCTPNIKKHISAFYDFSKDIHKTMLQYLDQVLVGIISPSNEEEKEIIKFLNQQNNKTNKDNNINNITFKLCILYLNNKIINSSEIKNMIDKYASTNNKWLIHLDDLSDVNFEINWLIDCNSLLLKMISENKSAKEFIKSKFKDAYQKNKLDKNLLYIYFKYFVD